MLVLVLVLVLAAGCSAPFTPVERTTDASPSVEDASSDVSREQHDEHDAGACETIGRTGAADTCTLFAYCGHRSLQLDCSARFTCICSEPDFDGGPTKTVAAQAIFCESPGTDLASALSAARKACDW